MPLPSGYAPPGSMPRVNPQPPAAQPRPLPPQGTRPTLVGAPERKTVAPSQGPLILQPIIRLYHNVFGG